MMEDALLVYIGIAPLKSIEFTSAEDLIQQALEDVLGFSQMWIETELWKQQIAWYCVCFYAIIIHNWLCKQCKSNYFLMSRKGAQLKGYQL